MNIQNWFMGVVEEEMDPREMGRVKVRCFGYHSPDRKLLPTKDLPWTQTIFPVTAGPATGSAGSSPALKIGSIVFGAFYDGNELQDGIILGTVPGGVLKQANYDPVTEVGYGSEFGPFGPGIPEGAGSNEVTLDAASVGVVAPEIASVEPKKYADPTEVPSSAASGIAAKALKEVKEGVKEINGTNKGKGIQKYWSATSAGEGGYGQIWCAAFACWVVKEGSGLPKDKLPTSAFSNNWIDEWARTNTDLVEVYYAAPNASSIKPGDILVRRKVGDSHGHVSIVTKGTDSAGNFQTVDGNSGNAVRTVTRKTNSLSHRHYILRIKKTNIPPNNGEPQNDLPTGPGLDTGGGLFQFPNT